MPREQALYILVRGDLSKSQQAVQAGHAVAEFLRRHPDSGWTNGTLVYLKVKDDAELSDWWNKFDDSDSRFWEHWHEPDLGGSLTALAILGPSDARLSVFPDLPLV